MGHHAIDKVGIWRLRQRVRLQGSGGMNTATQWMTRLAIILLLTLTVGATVPTGALAGPRVRTGDACLYEHYTGYARFESPGTAFASEEECLDYANGGGTIVALIAGYAPVIGVYFQPSPYPAACTHLGALEGFVPRATYTVTYFARKTDGSGQPFPNPYWTTTVQTNKYGNASWTLNVEDGDGDFQVQAGTVDGTVSNWQVIDC
jgi:hypothetical protein